MDKYCLYAHTNKINGKVYIGISKDIHLRWRNKALGYSKCTKILNAFKKYGWDNFEHTIIAENLSKEDACELEKLWIWVFKGNNTSYNITDGGEGTSGVHRSERHKQILRERMTGRYVSSETRAKLSKTHKEQHITGKKVYAFDTYTKKLVRTYITITEAALDVGIPSTNISRAARGKRPSAAGFIWSYFPTIDKNNPLYNKILNNKK